MPALISDLLCIKFPPTPNKWTTFHYSILDDKTQALKWQCFIFNFNIFILSLVVEMEISAFSNSQHIFQPYFGQTSSVLTSDGAPDCAVCTLTSPGWICCSIAEIGLGGQESSAGKAAGFILSPALISWHRKCPMGESQPQCTGPRPWELFVTTTMDLG